VLVRAARREPRPREVRRPAPSSAGVPLRAPARAASMTLLAAGLTIAACSGRATPAANLSWTLTPPSPAVGPATLTMSLRDRAGRALSGGRVRVEGHMSHPGMTPVVADAAEQTPGVYSASFTFTMPGDWVLAVSATLPDGRRVEQRIEVPGVRSSSEGLRPSAFPARSLAVLARIPATRWQ